MRKIQKIICAQLVKKGSRTFRPTGPVYASTGAGGIRSRGRGRNRPKSPRRASCAARRGGVLTKSEGAARRRKNIGFSPRFRRDFAGFILKQE